MTTLEFTSEVPATQRELFDFHMDFTNVRIVTPPVILTRFAKVPETMRPGSCIVVEINQLGFWLPWEITVQQIVPDQLLVDVQQGRGPFKNWTHEHRFMPHGDTSVLTDKIMYTLPFGPFGALIDLAVMRFVQKKIFAYRHKKTIEYFLNR
jgi:ligand-binding SRPBCC domain-containing protein